MRLPWIIAGLLIASSAVAQTPLPTVQSPEHALAELSATKAAVPGFSAIAGSGANFLVSTAEDQLYMGYRHAMMLLDRDGNPQWKASYTVFDCGDQDGVATNGTDYLVVFGCHGGTTAVRFGADGTAQTFSVHAPTRVPMSSHDTSGTRSVAWDGQQFIVVSTLEKLADSPLRMVITGIATRVSASGEILQNEIPLAMINGVVAARNGVSVVASASPYATSATQSRGVTIQSLNAAGVTSDPLQISTEPAGMIGAAAGSDGFLVAWSDGTTVRARHLDPSGRPDAAAFTIVAPSVRRRVIIGSKALYPTVTAEASSYRIAWSDGSAVYSVRAISSRPLDGIDLTAAGSRPAIASDGNRTLLVWSATDNATHSRNIDSTGEGQLAHRLMNSQFVNAIGVTTAGPSVAWTENSSRFTSLATDSSLPPVTDGRYTLLRGLNRPLIISGTAAPYTFRYADEPGRRFALPTATPFWIGNGFLCAWTDDAPPNDPFKPVPLYVQRFDAYGTPIDAAPRQIGTSLDLDLAFSGAAALYSGVFAAASNDEVLFAFISPEASLQGVLLKGDQATPISEILTPQWLANPISIDSDDRDFLVSFISGRSGSNSFIASHLVLADGSMPDPVRIDSLGNDRKDSMATFWTGQNYLVVWTTASAGPHDVTAVRIARDGKLIDYPPVRFGTMNFDRSVPMWTYDAGVLTAAYVRAAQVFWTSFAPPH